MAGPIRPGGFVWPLDGKAVCALTVRYVDRIFKDDFEG
jgi:hypothetical protein